MTMPTSVERRLKKALLAPLLVAAGFGAASPAARADSPAPLPLLIDLHEAAASHWPALPGRVSIAAADGAKEPDGCPALLQQTFTRLQGGAPESLCQYKGKVLVVVNTASYCGFTRQYEGLEALYRKHKDRGLVVIGFPSNDFSQEPGTNQEVAEFCRTTYGVQFPMYEKSSVTRLAANPFYAELAKRSGQAPRWNFHKYVVDRTGTQVTSFGSTVEPDQKELSALIERLLAVKPPAAAS
jgi:glutathione peroxidase